MAMRAQGVVWAPTAIHVGSYVGVMLPLCWWLALVAGMGVWGVVIGISVASVLAGVAQVAMLEWVSARSLKASRSAAAA
jgi:MATE family multidrug resistance protein